MPGDDLFSRFLELSESGGQVDRNPELALCIYYTFIVWEGLFQVRINRTGRIIARRVTQKASISYKDIAESLRKELLHRLRIEQNGPLREFLLDIQTRLDENDTELRSYEIQMMGRKYSVSMEY